MTNVHDLHPLDLPDHVVALHDYKPDPDRFLCLSCARADADLRMRLHAGDGTVGECETWNLDLEPGEVFACDVCGSTIATGTDADNPRD